MKKLQLLAYAGAIALLSTGITACSDDNLTQEVTPSPGYNPETGEVTADFVFNVSTGTNGTSRMSSANVQASINTTEAETFRGIDNAKLFAYKIKNANNSVKDGWHIAYTPTPSPIVKMFDLGTVMAAGSITPASTGDKVRSRRVVELALPTETNTLLFYGKAIKSGSNQQQGSIEMSVSPDGDLAKHSFRLNKIIPDGSDMQTEFLQSQTLIAAVLTKIIRSSYKTPDAVTVDGKTLPANSTIKWSDYVIINRNDPTNKPNEISSIVAKTQDPVIAQGQSAVSMSNLGEILSQTYVTFNTIYNNGTQSELRAGSGPDIRRMMSDLYTVVATVKDAVPVNLEETIAKRLGQVICDNIESCFDKTTFSFKANSSLKTFTSLTGTPSDKIGDDANMNDFPKDKFNMPYGSTILQLTYNSTSGISAPEYSYMGAVPTYAMGGNSGSTSAFDPSNWVYPAELCYFGNSPVRVTDATKATAEYPDGTSNWMNNNNVLWDGWADNGHVLSTTRSVAMRNCVNYANALLKMNVKYGAPILYDNNKKIQHDRTGANENDNSINVGSPGQFVLTGIAIGGQNRSVGWNFLPRYDQAVDGNSVSTPQYSCMVYDSDIPSTAIPAATTAAGGSPSADNYTLLWDNWDDEMYNGSQRTVYVALEFRNDTGRDFWGMNNLIRKGGTFYITGKLNPDAIKLTGKSASEIETDKSLGIDWPADYEMPPYYTTERAAAAGDATLDSKTIQQRRVFMQDYMTEATFVLTENSLKYALIAVPDLRSTQISLGLSVDLKWNKGLVFDDVKLEGGQ
jgi:hypothetical protein